MELKVTDNNIECHFNYDYIIALMRTFNSDGCFEFFDKDEPLSLDCRVGLEQFKKGRKGMSILDYYGLDITSFNLECLETRVLDDVLAIWHNEQKQFPAGLPANVWLRTYPKIRAIGPCSSEHLIDNILKYQKVEFEKPAVTKQGKDSEIQTYIDGTRILCSSDYCSMGHGFSIKLLNDNSFLADGIGFLDTVQYHNGLVFSSLSPDGPLFDIMECKDPKRTIIIPEVLSITFDRHSVNRNSSNTNLRSRTYGVYQKVKNGK